MTPPPHRWQVRTTTAVLALAVVSTLLGLFRPGHYRDVPAQAQLYQVQDATILLAGVPVLAVGLWYARRGSLRGRVVWLGGLAYMTYMWASVAIQVTFNELFLVYVALFTLSLFTLVGGVLATDADAIRRSLEGRLHRTRYAAVIAGIALGLAALWLGDLAPAYLDGGVPQVVTEAGPQALVTHVLDLGIVVPALLLVAGWLHRGRPWGYALAGVVLVFGAALGTAITAMTLVLLSGDFVSVSPVAAVFSFAPVLLAGLLAVTYLRAIDGRDRLEDSSGERGQPV